MWELLGEMGGDVSVLLRKELWAWEVLLCDSSVLFRVKLEQNEDRNGAMLDSAVML